MFNAKSTTDEVLAGVDLMGKRILVTGVSAGMGVEIARALASHGAHVVGTARDLAKARTTTGGIANLELIELDLASLAGVRAAADALHARAEPFDAVIANAGVMAGEFGKTLDGFEMQFGTNHLGHFAFVNRIAPLLRRGGRLVMVSSGGHRFADVDLDDPGFEKTCYEPFVAYGRSKTANILFAVEFDRRHRDRGVRATAIHPGGVATELGRHMTPETVQALTETLEADLRAGAPPIEYKSIPQGAATSVWAAVVAPADAVGGRYCEDCGVAEISEANWVTGGGVRAYALDPERAKALWALSEKMVGETF
ncbi:SDR family NAD(P)-dependent oxidoreductase [Sphingobium indicum]|uniref:Probable oxidoreductase n=1 Tax=Sphingobium indicum TaxID=332055 RepID=A0A4Q4J5N2_9SPHN|nr:SDR family NAD(P)-dependent oxidoreductase [Sphingobium indicum]NYI23654.1 NAD(P)-dependent dehydrogenase (short-subunit alcohol dehydrogenase family) [Sphingobium indicum]RYM01503.1 SDR family NAD(P)-dependent oxidoreductase [Sphingobium indicum]